MHVRHGSCAKGIFPASKPYLALEKLHGHDRLGYPNDIPVTHH